MPKSNLAQFDRLWALNEILGLASDPERVEHARRALEFAYEEHPEDLESIPLDDYINRLAHIHFGGDTTSDSVTFAHWHVPLLDDLSPLWIRQAIVEKMKKLAGRRESVLLVTGLREAVCTKGKYWTKLREARYQKIRAWIDELVCAWATRGSNLQVVVL